MDRRDFLLTASAAAGAAASSRSLSASRTSLAARAASKGIRYGCAVSAGDLRNDAPYARAVASEAKVVVPEGELKRSTVQKEPSLLDFSAADQIVAFAAANGMAMRGHTFCWYQSNPAWLVAALAGSGLNPREKQELLSKYIGAAMRRYQGSIDEWDVVNEPTDPSQGRADGLRDNDPWLGAFGEHYIDIAFHEAREADPASRLFMNEFGVEADAPWQENKRTALLRLLERLKTRGVPIDGVGIQGHLQPYKWPFKERILANFLAELSAMGLRIAVTELDCRDVGGATDPAKRDADMAAAAKAFLSVVLDNQAAHEVLTWGLSDRHSWLQTKWNGDRWPDGQPVRGLPLDDKLGPKPLYAAIGTAFDEAAAR